MHESFSALGVSAPVVRALAAPRHHSTVRGPDPRPAGRARRRRRPRRVPHRLRQDARLRDPARRAHARPAAGRPAALVLVPTRELASQVVEELAPLAAARALRIAAVYGGTSVGPQAKRAAAAHILVATPGRLQT